jgi:hypothetical protein
MDLENFAKYEIFILVGILMVIGTVLKLAGIHDFSSDWFWLLAGVGLIIEGTISYVKQKRFDRKYKVVERHEAEKEFVKKLK